ncbi:single-stranded-DNA-specific exonuclease RecJ [Mastigocoleus testarum]|uniref:Single-stranded-DNA-specific exonuclease RecJ n=1 Tax=Mastigocoleus testarum BC008 TaxID=371196 RepID=A0A0V7ZQI2_9CYAN|nr:DHH family phosphoesterase [Mastigocoleus testarum]KST66851.1 single-stranded-DNA-specific exonuclease RecJ [Mastigocoleus testarum BC008]KST70189.1 single-stranded-DNA-specific exonuclease RecJ [Mastigocoleus testarum BC008]
MTYQSKSEFSKPEISQNRKRLPNQRWYIYPQNLELANKLAESTNLSPIINQLLINRGIETVEHAQVFLSPESLKLPSPLEEFPDLAISLELLQHSIATKEKIAICGDYDADGMTSTALLLRSLRWLGAQVDYAIPSRMHEGYGINKRIIEDFHNEGVGLVLTVDNGISAFEPIARARELGLKVIVTDHHDIPQELPPANAILNPKLISPASPYYGVAGVGVAYILAVCLAQQMGSVQDINKPMLELFTLGTIADLAPLIGVNRRWLKRGLQLLPKSSLPGVQALIQMSGVQARGMESQNNSPSLTPNANINSDSRSHINSNSNINSSSNINSNTTNNLNRNPNNKSLKTLKPEDIGFRLGPRINAIGRIGDPQIIIELLTTDDMGIALERAMQCEGINRQRQEMCEEIEHAAIAVVETEYLLSLKDDRVLVIVQPNWHHGVIGIVASRLLERYGVPVFIGTYEDNETIRGSARGIPEFHVFEALEFCDDLLGKYGGHKAAGGFSLPAKNLDAFRQRLSEFANQCLEVHHLKSLLKIDAQINFDRINHELYEELNTLEPCGIENPDPIFWTPDVQVMDQKTVGKGHIKLTLCQTIGDRNHKIKAIAWRWRDYFPLPKRVDIAYKLRENHFNGNTTIELEILGVRLPDRSNLFPKVIKKPIKSSFEYNQRHYICAIYPNQFSGELRIKNPEGIVLAVELGKNTGLLGANRQEAQTVDISEQRYQVIIQVAWNALSRLLEDI